MKTFYDQLNLARHASFEDIRTAINRRRFQLAHTTASPARQAQFEELNAAERVLLNPELRAQYDQEHFPAEAAITPPALPVGAVAIPPLPPAAIPGPVFTQPPPIPVAAGVPATCGTCGTVRAPGARHCPVCGTEFLDAPAAAPASSPGGSSPFQHFFDALPTQTPEQLKTFFRWIGWTYARGTIISADQPYTVDQEFILSRFLIKVAIFVVVAWIIYKWLLSVLGLLIVVVIIGIVLFMMLGGVVVLMLGSVFKLFTFFLPGAQKEKKQVSVRDVRLRDEQLSEYIVRFRGEMRSGHISVGDQIEIWGANRGGTIMGRFGYNFRTKSRIWVKYQ